MNEFKQVDNNTIIKRLEGKTFDEIFDKIRNLKKDRVISILCYIYFTDDGHKFKDNIDEKTKHKIANILAFNF